MHITTTREEGGFRFRIEGMGRFTNPELAENLNWTANRTLDNGGFTYNSAANTLYYTHEGTGDAVRIITGLYKDVLCMVFGSQATTFEEPDGTIHHLDRGPARTETVIISS